VNGSNGSLSTRDRILVRVILVRPIISLKLFTLWFAVTLLSPFFAVTVTVTL